MQSEDLVCDSHLSLDQKSSFSCKLIYNIIFKKVKKSGQNWKNNYNDQCFQLSYLINNYHKQFRKNCSLILSNLLLNLLNSKNIGVKLNNLNNSKTIK
ncbi:unnamed protein product [Paramecium octaurelia]|uniref:Uncharacterized protein n=1 Tax=Paramecium octaurelia TaxID=43137 RepID=A0A8S1YMQ9_PAROT|nr:unnamed protein product [Paramecium octaurelia]